MKTPQKGLTLVELMVAMLLGLIISGAALQLFMTNQKNFSLQQALSGLEEDGHMIIRYISADIRNAGVGNGIIGTVNPIISNLSTNGENGANDTIVINYLSQWDCQGTDLTLSGAEPEGQQAITTYSVRNETLFCSSDQSPGETAMLSGVESFQVLYGVDREGDGELAISDYVIASELLEDDAIVAVRFGLLLRSAESNLPIPAASDTFQVLDEAYSVATADKMLRRAFSTTVHIRNYHWEDI